jgi:hypothetical protein
MFEGFKILWHGDMAHRFNCGQAEAREGPNTNARYLMEPLQYIHFRRLFETTCLGIPAYLLYSDI